MQITKSFFLPVLALPVILFSCASNEIGESRDVSPETIYQQYRFEYDEQNNTAEIFAQFRFAGENGTTLILSEPSSFEYDGSKLKVDSNDFAGAFYKMAVPLNKVMGKHTLVFTDINKKKYGNIFTVDSFMLTSVPGEVDRRAPVIINFKAAPLAGDDYIELSSEGTDSSFSVKYTASQSENYIAIPAEQLARQRQDEFSVVATLYRKIPLQQQVKEGGMIAVSHTLKPVKISFKK